MHMHVDIEIYKLCNSDSSEFQSKYSLSHFLKSNIANCSYIESLKILTLQVIVRTDVEEGLL